MGGFECADHLNAFGHRVDLLKATGHLEFLSADYQSLQELGIQTVREGIRWSVAEPQPYVYDWRAVDAVIDAALETDMQVVWDICHFGFAQDLTPLHPLFAHRFACLCRAFARHYRSRVPDGSLILTPINEVSFLSWLGGDVRGTTPYTKDQGWDVKYHLMKAYIEGIEASLEVDAGIRILTTEPLIYVAPVDPECPDACQDAFLLHETQFQVLDMLSGKLCPELRGRPEYLDILGFNYYHNNQWKATESRELLPWDPQMMHPERLPLSKLLQDAWQRYKRPIVLSETSHCEDHRPEWLRMVTRQCIQALKDGIPLLGVCLYPVLDRPDWDFPEKWHHSGLWDIPDTQTLERILHIPTADALQEAQQQLKAVFRKPKKVENHREAESVLS